MRVGVVSFVNAIPLSHGLEAAMPGAELVRLTPARIADQLEAGVLDLGLVPVASLALHPEWQVLSGLGIASEGPVRSVLLVSHVPPERITRLVLDPASRTSNLLARLWLKHCAGANPEVTPGPPSLHDRLACGEATVAIGDEALYWRQDGIWSLDLGGAWTEWTGLPFVFAVWAGSRRIDVETASAFEHCYARNVSRLDLLARDAAQGDRVRQELIESYWRHSIRYRLGSRENQGLLSYLTLAAEAGYARPAKGSLHVEAV